MDLSLGTLITSCDTVFPDFWRECLAARGTKDGFSRVLEEPDHRMYAAAWFMLAENQDLEESDYIWPVQQYKGKLYILNV